MRKWIEFNINYPRLTSVIIILITIISIFELRKLYFDSSIEALMPKQEPQYILGEKAKKVFGDSKTFLLTAVEPHEGKKLFSFETFSHINNLVEELEEFKDFNYSLENERLETLLKLGNIYARLKH